MAANAASATTNNGVSTPTAPNLYDRFRDDYSPPVNKKHPYSVSTGAIYHVTSMPAKNAIYWEPISALFTTTLRL
jgi:hypothetical protein